MGLSRQRGGVACLVARVRFPRRRLGEPGPAPAAFDHQGAVVNGGGLAAAGLDVAAEVELAEVTKGLSLMSALICG